MYTARQRILNRHHRSRHPALFHGPEHVFKTHARKHFHVRTAQLASGFLTERAALPLKRDESICGRSSRRLRPKPADRRIEAGSIKSNTRSTL